MQRTIESPGVEINEVDLSHYSRENIGTTFFVNGFTSQGPYYEPLEITTISEYKTIFGEPTNAAERYAYHAVERLLTAPSKILFNKLPYDNAPADENYQNIYSAIFYPIMYLGTVAGETVECSGNYLYSNIGQDDTGVFYVMKPSMISLTEDDYERIKKGDIEWGTNIIPPVEYKELYNDGVLSFTDIDDLFDTYNPGILIVNKVQTSINTENEGYYIGVTDNSSIDSKSSIMSANNSKSFGIQNNVPVVGNGEWARIPNTALSFNLYDSSFNAKGGVSISEDIETTLDWDFGNSYYNDALVFKVYKLTKSGYTSGQGDLIYTPQEYFVGALGNNREYTDPNGFNVVSFNLEKSSKDNGIFADIFVNPNISNIEFLSLSGTPNKNVRVYGAGEDCEFIQECFEEGEGINESACGASALFSIGLYQDINSISNKIIGNLSQKLKTSFALVEDWETYPIDIVIDGGLSTVWTSITGNISASFDDAVPVDVKANVDILDDYWKTIVNIYNDFCASVRKDCMFIADTYRNIFINGKDYKVLSNATRTFSEYIYEPLKQFTSLIDTSYGAAYSQWIKVYDDFINDYMWVPFSPFQGAVMATLDAKKNPWFAPAGLDNGGIAGGVDIALKTNQKERDLLYRNNINPVIQYPNQGIYTWGQKTLQRKPSAFDRINVRRLFLTLEKETRAAMKYFVFQPNSNFTRTRVVNTLTPLLEVPKNNEGILDYRIICDERNNTPEVIDRNELRASIYIKPMRTAEYVLVDFYSTRTGQNFEELI